MYKYTFSDEDKEKLQKQTSISSNLLDKFKNVDDKYSKTKREFEVTPLNLEKMTYEKPSAEAVNLEAEKSLKEYKSQSVSDIKNNYDNKLNKIDENIEKTAQSTATQKEELQSLYGSLKKNISEDAIKRGLARSSIIVNKLEAFDRDMLDNYLKLDNEFKATFADLNAEKQLLETQKESALSAFDISYAIKLEEKIGKLNSEIAEKEESVLKYNNQIAEKEAQYLAEQEELKNKIAREDREDDRDLLEFLTKEGVVAYDDMRAREKYESAYEILKSIPKEDAISELKNNVDYRKHLGRYYDKLLSLFEA